VKTPGDPRQFSRLNLGLMLQAVGTAVREAAEAAFALCRENPRSGAMARSIAPSSISDVAPESIVENFTCRETEANRGRSRP